MVTIAAANLAALQAQQLLPREFVWFTAKDRATGDPVSEGYWSDVDDISAAVYNPDTEQEETRTWKKGAGLIEITPIARVANLTAQSVNVVLLGVGADTDRLLRTYEPRQGRVEIYRGFCDPDTRQLVAAAEPRFLGFIDSVELPDQGEGGDANATLVCRSHSSELLRSNPDTRSDASQRLRSATDDFFKDAATVGEWTLFWGQAQGTIPTTATPNLPWLRNGA